MNEPGRQVKVNEEFIELTKSCEALHKVISELEDRLAPVLRGQTPSPECKKADVPALVQLAQGLYERRADVDRGCAWLKDIVERLEL